MRQLDPSAARSRRARGFTLVELLVVIAIIALLAGLLIAAAAGALGRSKETRIIAEMNQFSAALEDYRNTVGSYPPNTQFDDAAGPIEESRIFSSFKRHLKRVAPQHRERDSLLRALVGQGSGDQDDDANPNLPGGMTAAEALVFWLGGFSGDPLYPISGVDGPSYSIQGVSAADAARVDPIESRPWRLSINIDQVGPRDNDNFFDDGDGRRYIVFRHPETNEPRRINFWRLNAPDSPIPYVYFDASRGSSVTRENDVPAATSLVGGSQSASLTNVYAIKTPKTSSVNEREFLLANDEKFQILHGGLDERWGVFPRIDPSLTPPFGVDSVVLVNQSGGPLELLSPEGPWTLDLADTLTNFANGTLEDAQ